MLPTINITEDIVAVERISPRRGLISTSDVVLLRSPENPMKTVTKMVLSLEGDTISFLVYPAYRVTSQTVLVPKGHVWVQGDNIYESRDSRQFGLVPYGLIQGRDFCKHWMDQSDNIQDAIIKHKSLWESYYPKHGKDKNSGKKKQGNVYKTYGTRVVLVCSLETLSTLKFAQRAKFIRNNKTSCPSHHYRCKPPVRVPPKASIIAFATDYLYQYRALCTNSDRSLSALWGKLAAEILMQNQDIALEELNRLKEIIDSKNFASPLYQLQNRDLFGGIVLFHC